MFNLTGGQFLYGNGTPIAGGTLTIALLGGPANIIATGGAAPSSYTFTLDANGVIIGVASVWGNAELTPAGTSYQATVKVAGVTVWGPTNWIVGPAAPYAGTLFPDVTVLPPYTGGGGGGGGMQITQVSLAPAGSGNFTVAHGLGTVPLGVILEMTSSGAIWFQSTPYDGTNLYLVASASGLTALAECFTSGANSYTITQVPVTSTGTGGNFTVAHGLGKIPKAVILEMTASGSIWFQSTPYDATNLYLVGSAGGLTALAECFT